MLNRRQLVAGGSAAALSSVTGGAAAAASDAAEFYRGKTVRILVGSPAGGGYDLYARLLAPHLAAKIDATVIVENKAGNGGLAALAALLVRPEDGLTIMHASCEAAVMSQMLERPGATWNVNTLQWIAKTSQAPKLWFVGANARYPTLADIRKANPLTWSATGKADNISDVAAIISYVLDLKSKIVFGYRGAGDMSLAVIRNEVDSGILSADSAMHHIENKSAKAIAMFAPKRWEHLPDVPTLSEAATIPKDKAWIVDLRQQIGEAQRAMVAAPGVPADRIGYLRDVFAKILTDPAVIEEGRKSGREIEYMSGTELQTLVGKLMHAAGPHLPEFRKVVLDSYF